MICSGVESVYTCVNTSVHSTAAHGELAQCWWSIDTDRQAPSFEGVFNHVSSGPADHCYGGLTTCYIAMLLPTVGTVASQTNMVGSAHNVTQHHQS